MGHCVKIEKRLIKQYGRSSELTYLSLDAIFGNIYPHWYFGFFGIGGWQMEKEVLQIRRIGFNNNSPLRSFNRLADSKRCKKWQLEIQNLSCNDDS